MMVIAKEFAFSASHVLDGLPEGHPCGRLHGHNYVVTVELAKPAADLDAVGFVRDYRDLDAVKRWLDDTVDHRHLNDVLGGLNPSAEQVARWVFSVWRDRLPELTAVRVAETAKTWAEYRPRPDQD